MLTGDAYEPESLEAEALEWFDDLGECPPVPEWLAIRRNKRRGKTYLKWRDEDGQLHAHWLPEPL